MAGITLIPVAMIAVASALAVPTYGTSNSTQQAELIAGPFLTDARLTTASFWAHSTRAEPLTLRLTDGLGNWEDAVSEQVCETFGTHRWILQTERFDGTSLTVDVFDRGGSRLAHQENVSVPRRLRWDGSMFAGTSIRTREPRMFIAHPLHFTSEFEGFWNRVVQRDYWMGVVGGFVKSDVMTPAKSIQGQFEWLTQNPKFAAMATRVPTTTILRPQLGAPIEPDDGGAGWVDVVRCFNGIRPWQGDSSRVYTNVRCGPFDLYLLDSRVADVTGDKPSTVESSARSLGASQIEWLVKAVSQSEATFKILCIDGAWYDDSADSLGSGAIQEVERKLILKSLAMKSVTGVVLLSNSARHSGFHEDESGADLPYPVLEIMSQLPGGEVGAQQCAKESCRYRSGTSNVTVTICAADYGVEGIRVEFVSSEGAVTYFTERSLWALR